jgi:hypothetical protein
MAYILTDRRFDLSGAGRGFITDLILIAKQPQVPICLLYLAVAYWVVHRCPDRTQCGDVSSPSSENFITNRQKQVQTWAMIHLISWILPPLAWKVTQYSVLNQVNVMGVRMCDSESQSHPILVFMVECKHVEYIIFGPSILRTSAHQRWLPCCHISNNNIPLRKSHLTI